MVLQRNWSICRNQEEDWKSKECVFKHEKYPPQERLEYELTSKAGLVLSHTNAAIWHGILDADMRNEETN